MLAACACAQDAAPDTAAVPANTVPPAPVTSLDGSRLRRQQRRRRQDRAHVGSLARRPGRRPRRERRAHVSRSGGPRGRRPAGTRSDSSSRVPGGYLDETADPGVDYHYHVAAYDGTNYSERVVVRARVGAREPLPGLARVRARAHAGLLRDGPRVHEARRARRRPVRPPHPGPERHRGGRGPGDRDGHARCSTCRASARSTTS